MPYTSDSMKKEYEKKYVEQRKKNLIKLREMFSLSLSALAKNTGISKNDISMVENGEKHLTLFHINAYKKFFIDNYNIDISVDYLMGYTSMLENISANISTELGLNQDSINTLANIARNSKNYDESRMIRFNTDLILNSLLSNEKFFIELLWNIFIYVYSDTLHPYIDRGEAPPERVELTDIMYDVYNNEDFFCLDDKLFESIAEREILKQLVEFKKIIREKEGD